MFCPKCGTKNPDNGKFCRSCGTDLGSVSDALSGKSGNKLSGFGIIKPTEPVEPLYFWNQKRKPVHWEGAIGKLFTGIAFLAVTIALAFSVMGTGWWFWMLIPAFSCLGAGIAQIIQLKKLEKYQISSSSQNTLNTYSPNSLPPGRADYVQIEQLVEDGQKIEAIKLHREKFGSRLKEAKEVVDKIETGQKPPEFASDEYVRPAGSIYDTGEIKMPPSVTESTTRHLEMNSEGETMTLPTPEKNKS